MGEELELGQLFIKVGDGGYVPFEGITQVNTADLEGEVPGVYWDSVLVKENDNEL